MTMYDARFIAWETAWKMTVNAGELRAKIQNEGKSLNTPLPEAYWACLAEARIFATLARTDTTVGLAAGDWIREEAERGSAEREHMEEFIAENEQRRTMFENVIAESEGREPICTCDWNRMACPIHTPEPHAVEDTP